MIRPGTVTEAAGPLRVHPTNPRYFADPSGRAVYLTGSHTWENLQDGVIQGYTVAPQPFDYDGYLDLLEENGHNFIRLWRYELADHEPQPWARTGPGQAADGKPKFDLQRFHQPYFDRLRARVIEAGRRGIYVGVMLFEDWIFMVKREKFPLERHPFHRDNNVNGVYGDPNGDGWGIAIHTLEMPAVLEVQKAYVRKVIETVNDLDNVLFEICNEGMRHTRDWQYAMIDFVRRTQSALPQQHPVGMTSVHDMNPDCLASAADWSSLGTLGWARPDNECVTGPPVADGQKAVLMDTDHIGWDFFMNDAAFTRAWVWKSFTRGYGTLLMETLTDDPGWIAGRAAMGHTRRYADRMDLARTTPQPTLASTGYCLANPGPDGAELLVYLPAGGSVTVDLSGSPGQFQVEWFDPAEGAIKTGNAVVGGGRAVFDSPFDHDAVLYLKARD